MKILDGVAFVVRNPGGFRAGAAIGGVERGGGWLKITAVAVCVLAWFACAAQSGAAQATRFTSRVNPYSIAYPADWRHFTGRLPGDFALFSYDEFVDTRRSGGFPANVLVARLPLAQGETQRTFTQESINSLAASHRSVRILGSIRVAGYSVPLYSYADTRAHSQLYLVVNHHAWVFSLTTASGELARWQPVFISMLRSFELSA